MTDEETVTKIAKACGWKIISKEHSADRGGKNSHGTLKHSPPDYCNDLNAMHEAEKSLNNEWSYADELIEITNAESVAPHEPVDLFKITHATARQRAEAFIKTMEQ